MHQSAKSAKSAKTAKLPKSADWLHKTAKPTKSIPYQVCMNLCPAYISIKVKIESIDLFASDTQPQANLTPPEKETCDRRCETDSRR